MILYTLVPIGVMILYGFNQAPSGRLTFAWKGFTLDWYRHLFDIPDLTTALVHSLEIAVAQHPDRHRARHARPRSRCPATGSAAAARATW